MNNKRNERYKTKGSILVITALAAIVWIFIAQSLFIVGASGFGMIKSSRVALQAQQYAEIEVDRLKNVAYENLDSDGAHPRQALTNIQESGWEDEVKVGSENAIHGSDNAKQRIATVNVYKSGDTIPRFTLEVPLSSQSNSSNWLENVDWLSPISIPIVNNAAQYVAPCDGIFIAHLHAANYEGTRNTYLLLNGIDILSGYSNGDTSGSGGIFPVSAGDVIKIISSPNEYHVSKFYPYKK